MSDMPDVPSADVEILEALVDDLLRPDGVNAYRADRGLEAWDERRLVSEHLKVAYWTGRGREIVGTK